MKRTELKTAKEVNQEAGEEIRSLLLEHPDPPPLEGEDTEPPLTQEELIEIRWTIFGKCPICHANVKGYNAGPFNVKHYRSLQDEGIDVLTGHKQTCSQKWRKA